jgi:Fe-S cluster biogenesis protein NfuA
LKEKKMAKDTRLYLEANPNPNSLKFVVNYMLVPEGMIFDFPDAESAVNSPLAVELFKDEYVNRVFIMNNFITVTKDSAVEWPEVIDNLKEKILSYLDREDRVVKEGAIAEEEDNKEISEVELRIRSLLDEYVKPAVEQDGGAIQFYSYSDGVVKVLLQGACSGCPSSTITLKNGIEALLKSMIPEVKAVEAEGI